MSLIAGQANTGATQGGREVARGYHQAFVEDLFAPGPMQPQLWSRLVNSALAETAPAQLQPSAGTAQAAGAAAVQAAAR